MFFHSGAKEKALRFRKAFGGSIPAGAFGFPLCGPATGEPVFQDRFSASVGWSAAIMPMISVMLIMSIGGLIPFYNVMSGLKLINTPWSVLSVWNLFMIRTFFDSSISDCLVEEAVVRTIL